MALPSIAVNTLRPKKNGNPQSNVPGFGPANETKTKLFGVESNVSALATLKFTVSEALPEVVTADRLVCADGQ